MSTLIRIDSSIQGSASVSNELATLFQERWLSQNPDGDILHYDLGAQPLNHIDGEFVASAYTPKADRTDAQIAVLEESDKLINDLRKASHLLISSPMYNFSVPSSLKAYFDHLARVGETFEYRSEGPKGLLDHLTATVIVTSGGDYTTAPNDSMDFATHYVETFLNFIGIQVDRIHTAPGLAGAHREASIAQIKQAIGE